MTTGRRCRNGDRRRALQRWEAGTPLQPQLRGWQPQQWRGPRAGAEWLLLAGLLSVAVVAGLAELLAARGRLRWWPRFRLGR